MAKPSLMLKDYAQGDRVSINGSDDHKVEGTIKQVGQASMSVTTDDGREWLVNPALIAEHTPQARGATLPAGATPYPPPDMPTFRPGDAVEFTGRGGRRGTGKVRGLVRRVNQKTISVYGEGGRNWKANPLSIKHIERSELDMSTIQRPGDHFKPGDRVRFNNKGNLVTGTVRRINEKTVGLDADDGRRWRVPPGSLHHCETTAEDDASANPVAPAANAAARPLAVGDAVEGHARSGRIYRGRLIRINDRTASVTIEDGRNWRMPLDQLQRIEHSVLNMVWLEQSGDRFSVGDQVRFEHKGRTVPGRVERINKKSVGVLTDEGEHWRISPRALQHDETPEPKGDAAGAAAFSP